MSTLPSKKDSTSQTTTDIKHLTETITNVEKVLEDKQKELKTKVDACNAKVTIAKNKLSTATTKEEKKSLTEALNVTEVLYNKADANFKAWTLNSSNSTTTNSTQPKDMSKSKTNITPADTSTVNEKLIAYILSQCQTVWGVPKLAPKLFSNTTSFPINPTGWIQINGVIAVYMTLKTVAPMAIIPIGTKKGIMVAIQLDKNQSRIIKFNTTWFNKKTTKRKAFDKTLKANTEEILPEETDGTSKAVTPFIIPLEPKEVELIINNTKHPHIFANANKKNYFKKIGELASRRSSSW